MAKTPPFSVCYQYCVGGGGENPGANAVQSDYAQNDSSKLDYIKNRPFYEEAHELGSVDGINETQIPVPVSVGDDLYITFATVSGLFFDARIKLQEGVSEYRCCVDCVKLVFSGMWLTVYNVSKEFDLSYTGTITVSRMAIAKLPDRFIPDNIKYCFDKVKLGENTINSANETNITVESGTIQKGDVLLIKGTLNGVTEEYETGVPELGGIVYGENLSANIGNLNFVGDNTIWFTKGREGTKIEVYKLNKKPISEATTELYGIVKEIDEALDRVIEKYGLGELTLEKLLADNPTAIGNYPSIEISAGTYKVLGCVSNEDSTLYTDKDLIIHCALYPVGSSPEDETILSLSETFTIDTDSVLEYPYIPDDNFSIEVTIYIVKVG